MVIASAGPLALIYRLNPIVQVIYEKAIEPCPEILEDWVGECAALCIQMLCTCSFCCAGVMTLITYVLLNVNREAATGVVTHYRSRGSQRRGKESCYQAASLFPALKTVVMTAVARRVEFSAAARFCFGRTSVFVDFT